MASQITPHAKRINLTWHYATCQNSIATTKTMLWLQCVKRLVYNWRMSSDFYRHTSLSHIVPSSHLMSVVIPAIGASHNDHPVFPLFGLRCGQWAHGDGQTGHQQDRGLGQHLCGALQCDIESAGPGLSNKKTKQNKQNAQEKNAQNSHIKWQASDYHAEFVSCAFSPTPTLHFARTWRQRETVGKTR